MKVGDLVKVVGCNPGHGRYPYPEDFEMQNEVGTIIKEAGYFTAPFGWLNWWTILFPSGAFDAREDRIEKIR